MATEKLKATTVKLGTEKGKLVRFSHLHVFKPHLNTQSKKEEYSVQLWVPKENEADVAGLRAAIDEQTAAYKKVDGKPGPEFHNPLKDGDKLTDVKGNPKPVPGHWVISAKTHAFAKDGTAEEAPGVVGINRDEKGALIPLKSSEVKSGDYGRVSINLKFFTEGKGGIGVYLNSLQKVKTGEALGGRRSAAEEFADFDDEDDEDPLG
jgi:hypothetical protein